MSRVRTSAPSILDWAVLLLADTDGTNTVSGWDTSDAGSAAALSQTMLRGLGFLADVEEDDLATLKKRTAVLVKLCGLLAEKKMLEGDDVWEETHARVEEDVQKRYPKEVLAPPAVAPEPDHRESGQAAAAAARRGKRLVKPPPPAPEAAAKRSARPRGKK